MDDGGRRGLARSALPSSKASSTNSPAVSRRGRLAPAHRACCVRQVAEIASPRSWRRLAQSTAAFNLCPLHWHRAGAYRSKVIQPDHQRDRSAPAHRVAERPRRSRSRALLMVVRRRFSPRGLNSIPAWLPGRACAGRRRRSRTRASVAEQLGAAAIVGDKTTYMRQVSMVGPGPRRAWKASYWRYVCRRRASQLSAERLRWLAGRRRLRGAALAGTSMIVPQRLHPAAGGVCLRSIEDNGTPTADSRGISRPEWSLSRNAINITTHT